MRSKIANPNNRPSKHPMRTRSSANIIDTLTAQSLSPSQSINNHLREERHRSRIENRNRTPRYTIQENSYARRAYNDSLLLRFDQIVDNLNLLMGSFSRFEIQLTSRDFIRLMEDRNNEDDANNDNSDFTILTELEPIINVPLELVQKLPVVNITNSMTMQKNSNNCIICMTDYAEGDKGLYLPCFHIFHEKCILKWFDNQSFCPICKTNVQS